MPIVTTRLNPFMNQVYFYQGAWAAYIAEDQLVLIPL